VIVESANHHHYHHLFLWYLPLDDSLAGEAAAAGDAAAFLLQGRARVPLGFSSASLGVSSTDTWAAGEGVALGAGLATTGDFSLAGAGAGAEAFECCGKYLDEVDFPKKSSAEVSFFIGGDSGWGLACLWQERGNHQEMSATPTRAV